MGGQYLGNFHTFMFENPIFEHYITTYMEETQDEINETISFEQFKTITWDHGFPCFIIEFLGYITGQPSAASNLIEELCPLIHGAIKHDL